MHIILILFSVVLFSTIIGADAFAEKSASIKKTVNVDKESIVDTLSNLGEYSQILPDYIQSSRITDDNIANMKIGLDWITVDTEIKFVESNDGAVLEVISGDFKGTTLDVTMHDRPDVKKTDVIAELNLQTSWYMGIITSFVSDDDIESMLHTSLDGLVEYIKNPQPVEKIEEEKFCIFSLCF